MTQYIKPILFAVLISLASSAVFAASNVSETGNPSDDPARRSPVGAPAPATGTEEEDTTTSDYAMSAVGAVASAIGNGAKAAVNYLAAGAARIGSELHEFVTETVPDGRAAIQEDATYAGGRIAEHAQTAGAALSGYAATAGAAVKNHAATAGDAVMGDSEAKREAAAARYPQPIKGALEAAADFAAVHRAPDTDIVAAPAGGAGTAVATAGTPVRSDAELIAEQGVKLAAHNAARTGDGSGGGSSGDPI